MTQVSATAAETKKAMARESAATKTWRHVHPAGRGTPQPTTSTSPPPRDPARRYSTTRPDGQIDVIFLL